MPIQFYINLLNMVQSSLDLVLNVKIEGVNVKGANPPIKMHATLGLTSEPSSLV